MKKYILGTLLIATLVIVGGIKFFNNPNNVSAEVVACGAGYPGNFSVGDCYGGMRCTNTGQAAGTGVWVLSTACGALPTAGGVSPTLSWTPSAGATYYIVQISSKADFSDKVYESAKVTTNSFVAPRSGNGGAPALAVLCHANGNDYSVGAAHPDFPNWKCSADGTWGIVVTGGGTGVPTGDILSPDTTYYWRVLAGNAYGKSAYSQVFNFKTGAAVVGTKPSIISDGNIFEDVYSLVATLGKWTDKSGKLVNPKSVTKAWVDENNQRVYPVVGSENAANFINSLILSRGGGSGPAGVAIPCGSLAHGSNGIVNGSAVQCCETNIGGGIYAWNLQPANSCNAISTADNASATQTQ